MLPLEVAALCREEEIGKGEREKRGERDENFNESALAGVRESQLRALDSERKQSDDERGDGPGDWMAQVGAGGSKQQIEKR